MSSNSKHYMENPRYSNYDLNNEGDSLPEYVDILIIMNPILKAAYRKVMITIFLLNIGNKKSTFLKTQIDRALIRWLTLLLNFRPA